MERELLYDCYGNIVLLPGDDGDSVVDELIRRNYREEFCISPSFESDFVRRLIRSGFLVMSAEMPRSSSRVLLPKLHLKRAVLTAKSFHVAGSVKRSLKRYTLRVNADFEQILTRCALVHGEDWLTKDLQASFLSLQAEASETEASVSGFSPGCFALYHEGKLAAGEFGFFVGSIYTSYSGFYEISGSGSVQMALSGRWLFDKGYTLWDLGMPLEYKTSLGASSLSRSDFIASFRAAREGKLHELGPGDLPIL
ncbi:hypothetical protein MASR2M78_11440 [Treponema sp.]